MRYLKRLITHLVNKLRLRKRVDFSFSSEIRRGSTFDGNNKIYNNSYFAGHLGRYSYISINCYIHAKIGAFTSIGPNCITAIGRHPYTYPYTSTSPVFFSTSKQCGTSFAPESRYEEIIYADFNSMYPVVIGNDCWINAGVIIVAGVTIGDGVIALAGSVITKDVPPYAIVAGVPAKVIRYRYSDDDIQFLLDSKWWMKDDVWFKENYKLFSDISEFKKNFPK